MNERSGFLLEFGLTVRPSRGLTATLKPAPTSRKELDEGLVAHAEAALGDAVPQVMAVEARQFAALAVRFRAQKGFNDRRGGG